MISEDFFLLGQLWWKMKIFYSPPPPPVQIIDPRTWNAMILCAPTESQTPPPFLFIYLGAWAPSPHLATPCRVVFFFLQFWDRINLPSIPWFFKFLINWFLMKTMICTLFCGMSVAHFTSNLNLLHILRRHVCTLAVDVFLQICTFECAVFAQNLFAHLRVKCLHKMWLFAHLRVTCLHKCGWVLSWWKQWFAHLWDVCTFHVKIVPLHIWRRHVCTLVVDVFFFFFFFFFTDLHIWGRRVCTQKCGCLHIWGQNVCTHLVVCTFHGSTRSSYEVHAHALGSRRRCKLKISLKMFHDCNRKHIYLNFALLFFLPIQTSLMSVAVTHAYMDSVTTALQTSTVAVRRVGRGLGAISVGFITFPAHLRFSNTYTYLIIFAGLILIFRNYLYVSFQVLLLNWILSHSFLRKVVHCTFMIFVNVIDINCSVI